MSASNCFVNFFFFTCNFDPVETEKLFEPVLLQCVRVCLIAIHQEQTGIWHFDGPFTSWYLSASPSVLPVRMNCVAHRIFGTVYAICHVITDVFFFFAFVHVLAHFFSRQITDVHTRKEEKRKHRSGVLLGYRMVFVTYGMSLYASLYCLCVRTCCLFASRVCVYVADDGCSADVV